ncbi:MAG: aminotransferase class I/II-fold pyridoxal phosphate-dependent enzyme [Oscillospiraceae bacterium]|nr:aminotransferase class I/II-fold pyridoxal phosphate-dependent enzyme [Oscillospiraceae bacterium]
MFRIPPLKQDEEGIWRIDFADMEEKLVNHHIHTMILCSPHNPTGRVWERWELDAVAELCRKHDVYVISDEIWSDIVRPDAHHIPTQSVSEELRSRTIALYAPSKTFSLAGLVGSYHIICSKRLKDRMDKEGSLSHYNSMNVMSMHALIAAYSEEGRQWADELNEVIAENVDFACDFIRSHFEGVAVSKPQGTYMLFIDCTEYCARTGRSIEEVLHAGWNVGVGWQDGRAFHGPQHIRINLALPKARLEEALNRMKEYVFI